MLTILGIIVIISWMNSVGEQLDEIECAKTKIRERERISGYKERNYDVLLFLVCQVIGISAVLFYLGILRF